MDRGKPKAMNDLFNNGPIRCLGLYQPYASLMLHGKIETRLVRRFKSPPFPLGKYLIYSTKKDISIGAIHRISGTVQTDRIYGTLIPQDQPHEPTATMFGYAIAVGDLDHIRPMTAADEDAAFALYQEDPCYKQWCLIFKNVQRIEPFVWLYGKQGIGIIGQGKIPASVKDQIKVVSNPIHTCA